MLGARLKSVGYIITNFLQTILEITLRTVSNDIIRELKRKFYTCENWFLAGFQYPIPNGMPKEYVKLFNQNPLAYSIFRQALFKFIHQVSGEDKILNELGGLVAFLKRQNACGFKQVLEYFNSEVLITRFKQEWLNAFQTYSMIKTNEITQEICYFYQAKYEIDEMLLFIAILRKLLTDNVIDLALDNLKDRTGLYRKGVMVDYISNGLASYPSLKHAIEKAYIPRLRNTIGHNKYKIENGQLKSLDNTITVTKDELFESLYNMQQLHNAIIWICANIDYDETIHSNYDFGVISIRFKVEEKEQLPGIDLFQLWCFYESDAQKNWLRNAIFSIKGKELTSTFTSNTLFKGPITPQLDRWLNYAQKRNNVLVEIHSVIPFIGDDQAKIELSWGTYQIVQNSLIKYIPVQITTEK